MVRSMAGLTVRVTIKLPSYRGKRRRRRRGIGQGHGQTISVTAESLFHSGLQFGGIGAAQIAVNDVAQAVDDESRRISLDEILGRDVRLRADQQREGVRLFAGEFLHGVRALADIEAEDDQAALFPIDVHLLEARHKGAAGWAPGGPEIDYDDSALELTEVDGVAAGIGEREIRRYRADERLCGGGCRTERRGRRGPRRLHG